MPAIAQPWVSRLAGLARIGRTLLFRLVGPADWALRRLRGRDHLPPLWLRRHTGPLRLFESAAREAAAMLDRLGLVRPGDLVVDLGCGCGSMVLALGERIGERGRYVGIDVHGPSIRWCRRRFGADPRFRFELVEAASPFAGGRQARPIRSSIEATHASRSAAPVETDRLPMADGAADFILAKSLFTHLLESEAKAYLAEIRRILAPGRRALVTAFLFAGDQGTPLSFPHPRDTGSGVPVRWLRAAHPRAAVAYDRGRFEGLVAEAGLETEVFVRGFWPGADRPPKGQDTLVLQRPAEDP